MLTLEEDMKFYQLLLLRSDRSLILKRFKLLFKASEHMYSACEFHKFCDGHAPTLTIIQSCFGNIFGGHTSIEWSSEYARFSDESAFLFLIRSNSQSHECPIAFDAEHNLDRTIGHHWSFGPAFGCGDIYIGDKCNWPSSCRTSNVNSVFNHVNQLCGRATGNGKYGFVNFNGKEYEIFKII